MSLNMDPLQDLSALLSLWCLLCVPFQNHPSKSKLPGKKESLTCCNQLIMIGILTVWTRLAFPYHETACIAPHHNTNPCCSSCCMNGSIHVYFIEIRWRWLPRSLLLVTPSTHRNAILLISEIHYWSLLNLCWCGSWSPYQTMFLARQIPDNRSTKSVDSLIDRELVLATKCSS